MRVLLFLFTILHLFTAEVRVYDPLPLSESLLTSSRNIRHSFFLSFEASMKYLDEKSQRDECYTEILSILPYMCIAADTERLQRISFDLTNCFLMELDRPKKVCLKESPISTCLANLVGPAWEVYLTSHDHVLKICNHPQIRLWQKQNDDVINKLYSSTHEFARAIEDNVGSFKNVKEWNEKLSQNFAERIEETRKALAMADRTRSSVLEFKGGLEVNTLELEGKFSKFSQDIQRSVIKAINNFGGMLDFNYKILEWNKIQIYAVFSAACFLLTLFPRLQSIRGPLFGFVVYTFLLEIIIEQFQYYFEVQGLNPIVYAIRILMIIVCLWFCYPIIVRSRQLDQVMHEVSQLQQRAKFAGVDTPQFTQMMNSAFRRALNVPPSEETEVDFDASLSMNSWFPPIQEPAPEFQPHTAQRMTQDE